jgi:hypothetical protein
MNRSIKVRKKRKRRQKIEAENIIYFKRLLPLYMYVLTISAQLTLLDMAFKAPSKTWQGG